MKHGSVFCIAMILLASCQKELVKNGKNLALIEHLKTALKQRISTTDYQRLDFDSPFFSKAAEQQLYFIRIPFKGKKLSEQFLIVKTDIAGLIEAGRIVQLALQPVTPTLQIKGTITVSDLERKNVLRSSVENGYITALHPGRYSRAYLEPSDPDLVVVFDNSIQPDYSYYTSLNSFFSDYATGTSFSTGTTYYSSLDVYASNYYNGTMVSNSSSQHSSQDGVYAPVEEDLIEFEREYIYHNPGYDIIKLFNCFDNVPSAGATYSIKLCTDVPSNDHPEAISVSGGISAGHAFVIITKKNGSASVIQSFGFYPQELSHLDPLQYFASELLDNGFSEINASIDMNVSENQFKIIKSTAIRNASKSYNMSEYNCTNFAMDIFNSVRQNPLIIDPYIVYLPSNTNLWGVSSEPNRISISKSPQMVFRKLQEMKNSGGPEAAQIMIDKTHNSFAPLSKGECN